MFRNNQVVLHPIVIQWERLVILILKFQEMKTKYLISQTRKWLRRFVMAFMLGFSNVLNQETKMIDDTFFKIEQTSEDKEE